MNAIAARGLTKRFGQLSAVAGIDLTIGVGEVVALLGPNGAGKTTALDMILGLTTPTSGELNVLGTTPTQAIRAGRISALLQTGGLLADMTVRETVTYIAAAYPNPQPVEEVLARTGLTPIAGSRVSKCSGGEQQRLKFALALLPEPDILILDEPTTGMDVAARREFWATMREEAGRGRTIVFATHYLAEAEEFAQRTILMNAGHVVADGPTSEVRSLAGLRHVQATLTDAAGAPEIADAVTRLAPNTSAWQDGRTLLVQTPDSDVVARHLLSLPDVSDLLITQSSLEDAFVALTSQKIGD
ncbi:ABC transporter ATP-binding protein [Trueperella pyogenes]|uniref:ABC transporter ATP-binding protein n=1 Tax=Trueperella pyogenes TaxID=1661 RepID=UPI00345DCE3A